MDRLVLTASNFQADASFERWDWHLREDSNLLAHHSVKLEKSDPSYKHFVNPSLAVQQLAPRTGAGEASVIRDIGVWIGDQVLGPTISQMLIDRAARGRKLLIEISAGSEEVIFRPVELAYLDGKALGASGVDHDGRFVDGHRLAIAYTAERDMDKKQPVRRSLRMLAVFSTPAGMKPLALHRERWALRQFILGCRRQNLVIDLQSLQYGASEARLSAMLREGDGWDIVHFSGHGLASSLSLEDDRGNGVSISTEKVCDLLHLTKARLKLVTLWSCESAESYVRDAKRALGIDAAGSGMAKASGSGPSVVARDGLATRLMRNLGCRVVAMRYSVTDCFASELAKQFYSELFFQKNVVASALEFAKTEALGLKATPAIPALSSATPVAFGANALDRAPQITPPESTGTPNWRTLTKMSYFDEEPRRFVGRGVDMAAATQALAVGSDYTGVVFTGMPGIGKSSCALELAYCHEHYFSRLAWWKATSVSSIQEFFQALHDQLKMRTRRLRNDADLRQLREEVAEGFRQSGVLLVIDQLDVLLQPDGRWIDPRWGDVLTSLTHKSGSSCVVLTSERLPANPLPKVMIRELEPLTEEEEYLLMRELPKIGTFFKDGGSAFDAGESTTDDDAVRGFLLQCREFAGGLPGLWEVVDELAGKPDRSELLARLVSRAAEEDGAGEEADPASSYRSRIQAWTEQALASVPEPSRVLFNMICLMEDSDRRVALVKTNWPAVWRRWHDREDPRPGHREGSGNHARP